jgi:hypothetical protein
MIGEFKKAYPNAKLIGVEAAIPSMSDKSIRFDGCMSLFVCHLATEVALSVWGRDPPDTNYGFEDEVSLD